MKFNRFLPALLSTTFLCLFLLFFESHRVLGWLFFALGTLFLSLNLIRSLKGLTLCLFLSFLPLLLYFLLKVGSVYTSYWQEAETPVLGYMKEFDLQEEDSGIAGINAIYVINLDRRIEKWERVKSLCESKGLHLNRFSAIDGKRITEKEAKTLAGHYIVRLDGGKMGCILSHLSVIHDGKKRGFDCVWILEDDIAIEGDISLIPSLLLKLNAIDPEWDILYTDLCHRNPNGKEIKTFWLDPRPDQKIPSFHYFQKRTAVTTDLMQIHERFGTHSMILSRRGMDKLLNYYRHVYLWAPYDKDIHYVPDIKEYCSAKNIVTQHLTDELSDTSSTRFLYLSVPMMLSMGVRGVKEFILGKDALENQ